MSSADASPRLTFQQYGNIRKVYGDEFLAYVLSIEDRAVLDGLADTATEGQAAVMTILWQVYLSNRRGTYTEQGLEWAARMSMDRYIPEGSSSLANFLRRQTGGAIVAPRAATDPVAAALLRMLVDTYPNLLLSEDSPGGITPNASIIHNHPARADLETAVLADPVLSKLYPQEAGHGDWRGVAFHNTQGGGVQLWGFASQQIGTAYAWAGLDVRFPSIDDVADKVLDNLAVLRKAIQGKKAMTPARIALTGLLLPEDLTQYDFGWATLQPLSEAHRAVAHKTGVEGQLQTSLENGTLVTIDYSGDIIASFEIPYRIVLGDRDIDRPWPSELVAAQTQLMQDVENLRLGVALALHGDQPVLAVLGWLLTIDPLSHGAFPAWNDTRQTPNLMPRRLTHAELESWKIWTRLTRDHRTPGIAVSVRRMLQALSERRNPEDVLVDAVIVWENLFGAQQETTHRVSTALAWLLAVDATDRAKRQAAYKKLYALRSNIVHGSPKVTPEKVAAASRETVQISLAALRAIFEHRPDLLLESTSEARGNKLLLDMGPSPAGEAASDTGPKS